MPMSNILLHKEFDSGVTGVSNLFIDTYMKDANDAELKIYLYLLRMTSSERAFTISDIADCFNHTERDVVRSLKYWEQNKLLKLDYAEDGTVMGINLLTPSAERRRRREDSSSNLAPVISMVPEIKETEKVTERTVEKETVKVAKPDYTTADMAEFSSNPDTAGIICLAEQYFTRTLSPADIKNLMFINKELHFDFDMMDVLLEYCASQGCKTPAAISKIALGWHEQGIDTPSKAKKRLSAYDKTIKSVMKALGKNTVPTAKEVEFINKWTITYNFSEEVIFAGCERCVMGADTHRFEYADGIFTKWYENKLVTLSDIEEYEKNYRSGKTVSSKQVSFTDNKSAKSSSAKGSKKNDYSGFLKADYDFEALEKSIL